jgi:glucose-1-phosphate thymidylyltransferase
MGVSERAPLGVILTAGMGTRLRPLTPAIPKSLIPMLNRPLLAYGLEYMTSLGLNEIAVVVGPGDTETGARAIELAPSGVTVHIAVQETPNGPGDAVASVGALLDDRTVAVMVSDAVLLGDSHDYVDAFVRSGATGGLLLSEVEDPRAFGVAVLEGPRILDLEEKPAAPRSNTAVVGLWLLSPALVERVRTNPHINKKGESDLTATFSDVLAEGAELRGWVLNGEWLDAGTLEGLLVSQTRLLQNLEPALPTCEATTVHAALAAGAGSHVSGSRIAGPVLLGEDVRIEGCELDSVTVGDGARLRNVRLRNALVLPGATLEGGEYSDVVVLATGDVAGPGVAALVG